MEEAGSFEDFQRVRASAHLDLAGWPSSGRVSMDTFAGTRLGMEYDGPHRVDGEAIDYTAWDLMETPGVNAPLGTGKVSFRHGDDELALDFDIDPEATPLPMRVIG